MNNRILKTISLGGLTWFVPFFISFFFYDSSTKSYRPDYFTFKIIMILLAIIMSVISFSYLRINKHMNWVITAIIFLLISSCLDSFILITLFKYDTINWSLTVLPCYLIIYFGFSYLILNTSKQTIINNTNLN
jgi:hypothetical protein